MADGTQPAGGAIRVGDFTVDPRSGELRSEAGRQTLSAQPLNVLLALIDRPGEVVTRDELRARLWPADTYVDFEHGLNAIVKRLRDALGDSADTPRYIETVPRRGYRLIAPVERQHQHVLEPGSGPSSEASPPAPVPRPNPAPVATPPSRRRVRRSVAVIGACGLAVAGLSYSVKWRQAEAGADVHPVRITFGSGLQTDATWAPDGRRIAFAWDRDGNFDIYTQHVDGGEPTRITTSPANETQPGWSPVGDRLVFRADGDDGGVFTVGANGGPVRRVASAGARPVWMPGGREIAFADRDRLMQRIFVVRAEGGEPPREILQGQLTGGAWASFSVHPDGRIGVFGRHPILPLGFHVSDRAHGQLQQVTTEVPVLPEWGAVSLTRVHWAPTGNAVFVEAWKTGVIAIWRVPVNPSTLAWGKPVQLTAAPTDAERLAISRDGDTVAFTGTQQATRAWVFPFDADHPAPPGEGRAVTPDGAFVYGLNLSVDGSAIFYAEDWPGREDSRGLRTDLTTGATTLLADDIVSGVLPSIDGRAVTYSLRRRPPGVPIEFALAWRDATGQERLLSPWGGSIMLASDWRRDGRAVLGTYMRHAFTGSASLVEWPVSPSAASAPSRVLLESSGHGFWQARYSPGGRWIAFVSHKHRAGGHELGILDAERTKATWTRVAADHPMPDKTRWSPDGRTLYFLSDVPSGYLNLWGVRVDAARGVQVGAPFQLTHFDSPRWHVHPNLSWAELAVAKGRLALPMRTVTGSIWMLSVGDS